MIGLLCFVLAVLASPFKSKLRLEAENAVLRHQLIILRRKLRGRVQLANSDRWFFVQLYISLVPVYPSGSYNHPSGSSPVVLGLRQGQQARAVQLIDVLDNIIAANE
jgi:hypothetical protein